MAKTKVKVKKRMKAEAPDLIDGKPHGTLIKLAVNFQASASFTRPNDATPYTSGDLVANNTTAGSVVPMTMVASKPRSWSATIRRCRIRKSNNSVANSSFRLHLYKGTAPTVTNGDNGVWLSNKFDLWIGSIDVTVDKAFSDGAAGVGAIGAGNEVKLDLAGGQNVYGLLEARGAYTPANNEVFTCVVELELDH